MPPAKKPKGRGKNPQRKSPQSPPPEADAEAPSGDSPTESEKGSPAAEAGDFVGDPGPAFDAEAAAAEPEPGGAELHALEPPEVEWDEAALAGVLRAKGQVLHNLAGVGEHDWEYTEADLAAIAPPLARILNRYPVTRAAAGSADPIALAIAFGAYGVRSSRERSAVMQMIAEEEEAEPVPVTGVPASPGSGPPPGHPAAVGPTPPAPAPPQQPPAEGEVPADQIEWQRP